MNLSHALVVHLAIGSLALAAPGVHEARGQVPSPFADQVDAAADSWQKSCIEPDAQGSCLATEKQTGRHRCTSDIELLRPGKRRGAAARRAQKQLQALIGASRPAPTEGLPASDRSAMATALFHAAESQFEKALLLRAPTGLRFSADRPARRKRSEQRFQTFVADLRTHMTEVSEAYQKVQRSTGDSALQARSAHRTALLFRQFSRLFASIEIPIDVRTGPYRQDGIDAFCDSLAEQAEPLAAQAQAAAEVCVQLSEKHDLDALNVECGRLLNGR